MEAKAIGSGHDNEIASLSTNRGTLISSIRMTGSSERASIRKLVWQAVRPKAYCASA